MGPNDPLSGRPSTPTNPGLPVLTSPILWGFVGGTLFGLLVLATGIREGVIVLACGLLGAGAGLGLKFLSTLDLNFADAVKVLLKRD